MICFNVQRAVCMPDAERTTHRPSYDVIPPYDIFHAGCTYHAQPAFSVPSGRCQVLLSFLCILFVSPVIFALRCHVYTFSSSHPLFVSHVRGDIAGTPSPLLATVVHAFIHFHLEKRLIILFPRQYASNFSRMTYTNTLFSSLRVESPAV